MILQILKANWKVVAAIIGAALLALIIYGKWVNYGKEKYDSGYLAAVEAQKVKDKEASEQHERDKKTIEQEAQQRIDAARADASVAAVKSGRLQQQLTTIRKQLLDYWQPSRKHRSFACRRAQQIYRKKQTTGRIC